MQLDMCSTWQHSSWEFSQKREGNNVKTWRLTHHGYNKGDMHDVQCRVYMVGGAEATGAPNDTAVVYTPAFKAYNDKGERQVYVWNVTLPQHFFSRAPVDPDQRE